MSRRLGDYDDELQSLDLLTSANARYCILVTRYEKRYGRDEPASWQRLRTRKSRKGALCAKDKLTSQPSILLV